MLYKKKDNLANVFQIKPYSYLNDINIINNIVYNSFICNPSYFHNPIHEIKQLNFKFYDKYGKLLEYSDFEHSFTLEITTINEIPEGTNMSSIYPKIN